MSNYQVIVNEIEIIRKQFRIDVAVVCNNDCPVPKMRISFERNNDIRRLPLLMRNAFYRSESNDKIIYFSHKYSINNLFLESENTNNISVKFEISFGNNCDEDISFFVSKGVADNNDNHKVEKQYIGGELFNGITSYKNEQQFSEEETETDNIYDCYADPKNNRLVIETINSEVDNHILLFNAFSFTAKAILVLFTLIFCIALIPFFILDSLFATFNLVAKRKAPPTGNIVSGFIGQFKSDMASFIKYILKNDKAAKFIIAYKESILKFYYYNLCKRPVVKNRISFISGRRDELGGNEKFVYDLLKIHKDIDFKFLLCSSLDRSSRMLEKKKFYKLYATSKVIIVDDYYNLLNSVSKRNDVTLIQLWHACGAFKTFGFSRIGKPGGPKQTSTSHRMYDYTIVSSENIIKYYAEGFGLSDRNILPTGIPRTDIFRDSEYAEKIKKEFYSKHPQLKDKKIIMFAPTFRGAGQNSAYYPLDVFDPDRFYEKIGDEYAIIIKLHPFCKERFKIEDKYKDYIIDLSDEDELNDLLFVTDLLITDYSSAIFEASLLDIPMLFFSYDLYHYISDRDFYCDYETFVPGKIVFTQQALEEAVIKSDCETEKIKPFREKFFSGYDGKSSERVANFIIDILEGRNE